MIDDYWCGSFWCDDDGHETMATIMVSLWAGDKKGTIALAWDDVLSHDCVGKGNMPWRTIMDPFM